jgi:hypothetical protein
MYNGKEIRKVLKEAAEPAKKANPYGKDVSQYGYSDNSPFKDSPSLNIFTKDGVIDMSNTGIPLMANGRFLPPYSGLHQFDDKIVNEIPLANYGGNVFKKSHAPFDFEERARINEITMEEGGWLDDIDEFKRGGVNPLQLSRNNRRKTHKNIQSSINQLFLRNFTLYGPAGRNIYDPRAKYQDGGGWLDNL